MILQDLSRSRVMRSILQTHQTKRMDDSTVKRFEKAEEQVPKQECCLCYEMIPINRMYGHLRICMWAWEKYNKLPHVCYCEDESAKEPPHKKSKGSENEVCSSSQSSSANVVVVGGKDPVDPVHYPFNTPSYWLHAEQNSQSKKKEVRECSVSGKYCKQKPSKTLKDYIVVVHIGEKRMKVCRISHFSSQMIVSELNQQFNDIEKALSPSSPEKKFNCEKCKASCSGIIAIGSHYSKNESNLHFCTIKCMMTYLENKRTGDWESWCRSNNIK